MEIVRLTILRNQKNMTLEEMGKYLGCTAGGYYSYEEAKQIFLLVSS